MKLSIQTEESDLVRVGISGEVSQRHVSPLEDPLSDLLGTECYCNKVLLDMAAVDGLDSSGVGWLLSCQKRFKNSGGRLVLHSLSPFARDVLRVLNMHLVFQLVSDEKSAMEAVQEVAT